MSKPKAADLARMSMAYDRYDNAAVHAPANLPEVLRGESRDFIRGASAALMWASTGAPDKRFGKAIHTDEKGYFQPFPTEARTA